MFHEMLTGTPPFRGTTMGELLRQQTEQAPAPIGEVVSGVPKTLETLVQRGLSKASANRPATAGQYLEELLVAVGGRSSAAPERRPLAHARSRTRDAGAISGVETTAQRGHPGSGGWRWVVAGAVSWVLLVVVVGLALRRPAPPAEPIITPRPAVTVSPASAPELDASLARLIDDEMKGIDRELSRLESELPRVEMAFPDPATTNTPHLHDDPEKAAPRIAEVERHRSGSTPCRPTCGPR
ncbi:MAG: hypothetical protein HY815_32215 [Candidatus Riflebacteria bacterium]|nr:hypothetical protein [Candidatus Riflebacteria bacterium]